MEIMQDTAQEDVVMKIETTAEIEIGSRSVAKTVVNRIPASTSNRKQNKRRSSFSSKQSGSGSNNSNNSFNSNSSSFDQHRLSRNPEAKRCRPMDLEQEVFTQLDPNHPEQARRIFQRRKAIAKGKNTLGYQNYLAQVPKNERKPRSMKTPATPDPTFKLSAKRWQGLVKAWRIALHAYDPPELMTGNNNSSGCEGAEMMDATMTTTATNEEVSSSGDTAALGETSTPMRRRAKELERAAAMGLVLVDTALEPGELTAEEGQENSSSVSILTADVSPCGEEGLGLECNSNNNSAKVLWGDEDSDDELL